MTFAATQIATTIRNELQSAEECNAVMARFMCDKALHAKSWRARRASLKKPLVFAPTSDNLNITKSLVV